MSLNQHYIWLELTQIKGCMLQIFTQNYHLDDNTKLCVYQYLVAILLGSLRYLLLRDDPHNKSR